MGAGGLTCAVSDAGPLLHVYEIGQFALFGLFESVMVADAVQRETSGKQRLPQDVLLKPPFTIYPALDPAQMRTFVLENDLKSLHPGEMESLFICHRQSIALFLTDDLAARVAARKLDVTPVGSVGILVRAYRDNRLTKDETIHNLRLLQSESSLFVTSAIIDRAIEMILS